MSLENRRRQYSPGGSLHLSAAAVNAAARRAFYWNVAAGFVAFGEIKSIVAARRKLAASVGFVCAIYPAFQPLQPLLPVACRFNVDAYAAKPLPHDDIESR